jgi:hypothetical protein
MLAMPIVLGEAARPSTTPATPFEVWIAIGVIMIVVAPFIAVPLIIEMFQLPALLRKRRYGLFGLFSFIVFFSLVMLGAAFIPPLIAIWIPYR